MNNLHTNLNTAMEMIIDYKLGAYETLMNEKIEQLEKRLQILNTNPKNEILQQKEVFELLGIGRRRLKNWVDRGLDEIRVDNRVYYRYSDLINFMESQS